MSGATYPKPAVLWGLDLDGPAVLEASAGTGKTYALEHLVLDLILSRQATVDEILVVTYTEKATAELRARIRGKLCALLALGPDSAGGTGAPVPSAATWLLDDPARERLRRALVDFDRANVFTIHGFCQRVLTEHAFAQQRLFRQELVDGRAAFELAFTDALRSELVTDPQLRPWSLAVLASRDSTWLCELLYDGHAAAGPVHPVLDEDAILAALVEIHSLGLDPAGVAALELADRRVGERMVIAAELVERFGGALRGAQWSTPPNLPALLRALDEADEGRKQTFADLLSAYRKRPAPIGQRLMQAYTRLATVRTGFLSAAVQRLLPPVQARLAQKKRDAGLFDFDDLTRLVAQSLGGPGGERLRAALVARYRYALIDEFQDTDPIQWEIFQRLFMPAIPAMPAIHAIHAIHAIPTRPAIVAKPAMPSMPAMPARPVVPVQGPAGPLFLIGDPKQAIYGFRGADVRTYLEAALQVKARGGAVRSLEENFRSTPQLIDAQNELLRQDVPAPFFRGEARYDVPVRAGRPDRVLVDAAGQPAAPMVLFELAPGAGTLSDAKGPLVSLPAARRALLPKIAVEIRAILAGGLLYGPRAAPQAIAPREIFVLTRTGEEGRSVGRALAAAGVPHAFYKQDGLFSSPEAFALRDVLVAILRPDDRAARLRAWSSTFFAIPLQELAACDAAGGESELWRRLRDWKALADARDYERLFPRLCEESGFVRRARFLAPTARALTNVLHLCELLLAEAVRSRPTLRELLQIFDGFIAGRRHPLGQTGDVQRLESDQDAVQIMTTHKSKGLEATVVFLVGGYFFSGARRAVRAFHEGPLRMAHVGKPLGEATAAKIASEELGEEERLGYVALTRAKARVYAAYFPDYLGARLSESFKRQNAQFARVVAAEVDLPAPERRFERRTLMALGPGERPVDAAPEVDKREIELWNPPVELCAQPSESPRYARLRSGRAGFVVTSYSRMKGAAERASKDGEVDAAEFALEAQGTPEPERAPQTAGVPELPGGARSGIFLHELLEKLPLESLSGWPELSAWEGRPEVATLCLDLLGRHGLQNTYSAHSRHMLYAAYCTPVTVGGELLRLGGVSRIRRELEFLFPFPEASHPLLGDGVGRAVLIERGFIKGIVDLVFEQQGRVYFADWKSDRLGSFEDEALRAHVKTHYFLQSRLYALALVKILAVRGEAEYEARFGGMLYCFLRGMSPVRPGVGATFERPSWGELRAFERQLRLAGPTGRRYADAGVS